MMERCESHNRVQQRVRFDGSFEERCVEEAPRIVLEKVMVMCKVILVIVKKELEITRQVRVVQFARAAFFGRAG